MHDPQTLAFSIRYPWRRRGYRASFIDIWHVDPEVGGDEDSCGWFKRARHGNAAVLDAVRKDFAFEWDADYGGWFDKSGKPVLSPMGITLEMFRRAAWQHFEKKHRLVERFMRRRLSDILHFAENNVDAMHPAIVSRYGTMRRQDRIDEASSIVYGCILRWTQPRWRHARWHVWHWKLRIDPLQRLNRWLFTRCRVCRKRFGWYESPIGNWGGDSLWHQGCVEYPPVVAPAPAKPVQQNEPNELGQWPS